MIQKLKTLMLVSFMAFAVALPAAVPVTVSAASDGGCTNIGNKIVEGANDAASAGGDISCESPEGSTEGIKSLAANIVNIFSIIVGIVAVIMIIYGGFRYITSGGDSGSVGNAKNTLIYAIVGLIIVALAQLIVHFVLSSTSSITS